MEFLYLLLLTLSSHLMIATANSVPAKKQKHKHHQQSKVLSVAVRKQNRSHAFKSKEYICAIYMHKQSIAIQAIIPIH